MPQPAKTPMRSGSASPAGHARVAHRQVGGGHGELADAVDAGELQLGEPACLVEGDGGGSRRLGQFGKDGVDGRAALQQRLEQGAGLVAVRRHDAQTGDGDFVMASRLVPSRPGPCRPAPTGRPGCRCSRLRRAW
jgi:hypothetical protein